MHKLPIFGEEPGTSKDSRLTIDEQKQIIDALKRTYKAQANVKKRSTFKAHDAKMWVLRHYPNLIITAQQVAQLIRRNMDELNIEIVKKIGNNNVYAFMKYEDISINTPRPQRKEKPDMFGEPL